MCARASRSVRFLAHPRLALLAAAFACAIAASASAQTAGGAPQVRVGRVSGTLQRSVVSSLASRSWATINGCVGRSGSRPAQLTARFVVGAARRVEALAVRAPAAAAECVRQELGTWTFPADAGLGAAAVTFRTRGVDADLATMAGGLPVPPDLVRAGTGVVQAGQGLLGGGTAPLDTSGGVGSVVQAPVQAVVGALTGQQGAPPAAAAPVVIRHQLTIRARSVAGPLTRAEVTRALRAGRDTLRSCIDQRLPAGGRGERRVQVAVSAGRVSQRLGAQGGDEIAACVDTWLGQLAFPSQPVPTGVWLGVAYRPRSRAAAPR